MYTVTLIHKDGTTNVSHDYESFDEAEYNYHGRVIITPSTFPGAYRPFVAVTLHDSDNPIPLRFHKFN